MSSQMIAAGGFRRPIAVLVRTGISYESGHHNNRLFGPSVRHFAMCKFTQQNYEAAMIISSLDIFTVAGFAFVGVWLDRVGEKCGYLDAMFTPAPMITIAVLYDILRGFTP
jgi:hypothetical protein